MKMILSLSFLFLSSLASAYDYSLECKGNGIFQTVHSKKNFSLAAGASTVIDIASNENLRISTEVDGIGFNPYPGQPNLTIRVVKKVVGGLLSTSASGVGGKDVIYSESFTADGQVNSRNSSGIRCLLNLK
jgi:hypothetical protein